MRSDTIDDHDAQRGHALQYLIDLLTLLTTRMGVIEDFMANRGHPHLPPPVIALIEEERA